MSQEEVEMASSALSWPSPGYKTLEQSCSPRRWSVQHNARRYPRDLSQEPGEAKRSVVDTTPKLYLRTGSESAMDLRGQEVPSLVSKSSAFPRTGCERAAISLDLERRYTPLEQVRYSEEIASVSMARLRGGANQHQTGLFNRLRRGKVTNRKLNEGEGRKTRTAVTYKGREIGSPQPISTLDILTPASRFVRQPVNHTPLHVASESPPNNGYDVNGNHLPTLARHDHNTIGHPKSSLLPQPQIPLATLSQTATINPFVGIYSSPNVGRAGPTSPPTDSAAAGSLVDRPSALDSSQTGYGSFPTLHKRNSVQISKEFSDDIGNSRSPPDRPSAWKVQTERKWDSLPALPPEEAPLPPPKDWKSDDAGADDVDYVDTEALLNSLQPERLSLYHIGAPGRALHESTHTCRETTVIPSRFTHDISFDTLRPINNDGLRGAGNYSIRTREWDIQSCATDDLGIDNILKQHEQLAKNNTKRWISEEQQRQDTIRYKEEPANGFSENNPSTPESTFYAELTGIMRKYQDQREVLQRAFDAGEVSEMHWKRELWRYNTAMDQTVRAAAATSKYNVLTDEHEIREAINSAIGYAIYYELLSIRDPEKWHRILNPFPTNQQHHTAVPENSLVWLARRAGRAIRFMLAVPGDPNLKTHSSRRPPSTPALSYNSKVAVLGPNIPSRPEGNGRAREVVSPSTLLRQNFASARKSEDKAGSRTPSAVPTTHSTESTKVNTNTAFTGTTLASPLNGPHVLSPRSRGYEQSTFVTVLNPSNASPAASNVASRYGARRPEKEAGEARDDASRVTAWPGAEC